MDYFTEWRVEKKTKKKKQGHVESDNSKYFLFWLIKQKITITMVIIPQIMITSVVEKFGKKRPGTFHIFKENPPSSLQLLPQKVI